MIAQQRLTEGAHRMHAISGGGLSHARMNRMHEVMRRHVESGRIPGRR